MLAALKLIIRKWVTISAYVQGSKKRQLTMHSKLPIVNGDVQNCMVLQITVRYFITVGLFSWQRLCHRKTDTFPIFCKLGKTLVIFSGNRFSIRVLRGSTRFSDLYKNGFARTERTKVLASRAWTLFTGKACTVRMCELSGRLKQSVDLRVDIGQVHSVHSESANEKKAKGQHN